MEKKHQHLISIHAQPRERTLPLARIAGRGWTAVALLVTIIFSLTLLIPAATLESGTAEGTLTVNGQTSTFRFVYATKRPGFFDKTKEDSVVILSDMELDAEALEDNFKRLRLEREGTLHCVELTVNADQNLISVSVRHSGFRASPSGNSTEYVLELDRFDEQGTAGKAYCKKEQEFAGATYRFEARFSVEYYRKEKPAPPTAEEKKEAESSVQAGVYRAYEQAVRAADLESLKQVVASSVREMIAGEENPAEILEFMKEMLPAEIEFLRVKVEGESSWLTLNGLMDGERVEGKAEFIMENAQWVLLKVEW